MGNRFASFIGLVLILTFLILVAAMTRPVSGARLITEDCGLTYSARAGDTLLVIAERCNVSLGDLIAANPHIDPYSILPGQVLNIPVILPVPQPTPLPALLVPSTGQVTQQPLVQVSPDSGFAGTNVTIFGAGFLPQSVLHVGPALTDLQPVQLYQVQAGADGSFQVVMPVPLQAQPGQTWVILARDPQTGQQAVSNPFIVLGQPVNPVMPVLPEPVLSPLPGEATQITYIGHVVQPGETLFSIAQRYGTTVTVLQQLNPTITDPNTLFAGTVVYVPSAAPIPPTGGGAPIPSTGAGTYVIQRGDTLASIAARHGTTVQALLLLNPQIAYPDILEAGRVMRVN